MVKKKSDVPGLPSLLIIGDDPYVAAQISSIYAVKGHYVPVIDAPRLSRHDSDNEILRCNNVAARYQPMSILFANPSEEVQECFKDHLPKQRVDYIYSLDDLKEIKNAPASWPASKLEWGKKDIGLGLLQALRNKQELVFTNKSVERLTVDPDTEHLVICEDGDEMTQVMAANYAYAIGAGLCVIPEVPDEDAEAICEAFYVSSEQRHTSQTEWLGDLKNKLKDLSGNIDVKNKRLLTFITRKIPWGFAYPEIPNTHIFRYPHMGISLLNAIIAEQSHYPGLALGVMIDPQQVQASEIDSVKNNLAKKGVLLKTLQGPGANVYDVSRHVSLLPYDFLLFSTHCGDADGWQWTYEYVDSEGIPRTLVVNTAIGVGNIPNEEDLLEVQQFSSFVSLDGVDWNDPIAKEKLYVGTAIQDYIERSGDFDNFSPTKKETIDRVPGSSALKMWDHNYIPVPEQIAGEQMPIIFNNACLSWHRLASTFTFAHARAYIGTLFEVLDSQAFEMAVRITGKYFGRPLAVALWRAQNDVYGDSIKRPYILVGPHFQRLRITQGDKAKIVFDRMSKAFSNWEKSLLNANTEYAVKTTNTHLEFLREQMGSVLALVSKRYK